MKYLIITMLLATGSNAFAALKLGAAEPATCGGKSEANCTKPCHWVSGSLPYCAQEGNDRVSGAPMLQPATKLNATRIGL